MDPVDVGVVLDHAVALAVTDRVDPPIVTHAVACLPEHHPAGLPPVVLRVHDDRVVVRVGVALRLGEARGFEKPDGARDVAKGQAVKESSIAHALSVPLRER